MVATLLRATGQNSHSTEVTCVFAGEDHVFSGGEDGIIKVWTHDLEYVRDIEGHSECILSLAQNKKGVLYSTSRDGSLRYWPRPLKTNNHERLQQVVVDDLTAVYCDEDVLFSGDDKGTVTKWYNHKPGCQYNIIEEVKSLIVENHMLYTARDVDVVITDITPGMESYVTKATIPGRAPLALSGPSVDGHKKYLICTTRSGKGITVIRNSGPYDIIWTKEDAHDWIINAICANEDSLFTAGFDGKVIQWVDLDKGPKVKAEIETNSRVNAMCNGPDNSVYVGNVGGQVKRISF